MGTKTNSSKEKYNYFRLPEDFFRSNEITILEGLQDGIFYTNIYMKLLCKAASNHGLLVSKNNERYTIESLSSDLQLPVEVLEKAMSIYMDLGLVTWNDGYYDIPQLLFHTGISSPNADRVRRNRLKNKNKK